MPHTASWDVIIVGAGPAGLSAALILGRSRRRVLVCDAGRPRNAVSAGIHGFLTRDGIPPLELRRIGRRELARYDTVEVRDIEVRSARRVDHGFEVNLEDGTRWTARRLLLATGVRDLLPEIPGFAELYGRRVFHCPYCDGWEFRDEPIAIYGRGRLGHGLAMGLTRWTRDLALCTDGPGGLDERMRADLERQRIALREERVIGLDAVEGGDCRLRFDGGPPLLRKAVFFNTGRYQQCPIAAEFGCEFSHGAVATGHHQRTNVEGLFVAGDAARDVELAIIAAAEGAQAGFQIATDLTREDLDPAAARVVE